MISQLASAKTFAFGRKEHKRNRPGPPITIQDNNENNAHEIRKAKKHKEIHGGSDEYDDGDDDDRDDDEEDRNVDSNDDELISSSTLHESNDDDEDETDDWYKNIFESDSSVGRSGPIADNHDTNYEYDIEEKSK